MQTRLVIGLAPAVKYRSVPVGAEKSAQKLADYRDSAALKDMTDGEMFYIIKNGKGQMTGEADRVKPEEIWNLVNYVRSLAKKTAAAPPKAPGS